MHPTFFLSNFWGAVQCRVRAFLWFTCCSAASECGAERGCCYSLGSMMISRSLPWLSTFFTNAETLAGVMPFTMSA